MVEHRGFAPHPSQGQGGEQQTLGVVGEPAQEEENHNSHCKKWITFMFSVMRQP